MLAILITLTMLVAMALPVMAAKKGDIIEIFGEEFTVLDVVNRTYAFNHGPTMGRVWPVNEAGVAWFTNNGSQKASDMAYIGKTSLGLTWVLVRDDFFCPICGSNVWASYSNQAGAPNGNNIQLICVMEEEMIDCGYDCDEFCKNQIYCKNYGHRCNDRDCNVECECECGCVFECDMPCPNGVCNIDGCADHECGDDHECVCVCKCIIPGYDFGGMRIQSQSQNAYWWNIAGITCQINNNSGYGFAYLEVDADYFNYYSGIQVAFNRQWITGSDPSNFKVEPAPGISWSANAKVIFTADDFTLVNGKLVVNLLEYFNAPFQNSGNYFNQAILLQVIAVDVNA